MSAEAPTVALRELVSRTRPPTELLLRPRRDGDLEARAARPTSTPPLASAVARRLVPKEFWEQSLGDRDNALLRWLRKRELDAMALRQVTRIAVEVGGTLPAANTPARAPGDPRALRGIPAVGVRGGLGGAIAGTRPGDGLE